MVEKIEVETEKESRLFAISRSLDSFFEEYIQRERLQ